ncbi:DUF1217 domain-containing protein [Thalassobaculum sp. OXR-137]|uniref:DUF1217 domain-containing protein n=1 Tax=Thalassobaculum sp. OXR-137 TaxID=3100173 RepID=UPI002AC9A263|nr:DUF1217 domain-containing protein [Thalassobaculum sp. OXR-137]WPZ32432.1 DUF1217 domain-containing protein [Thalassobaculum sp. OXR-137]
MSNFAAASAILGGASGGGGGLLGAAYGGGGSSMSAIAAWRSYERDQVAARQAFLDRNDVQAAISDFKSGASKLETVDDLLDDRDTLQYVLTSFGLDADINNIGKIRKVIESDPDDLNSFANRLADTRYGELAKFLDTAEFGVKNVQLNSKQSELTDKYLTVQFERSLGSQNSAARDALFFLRRINSVENTFQILGDSALRAIVTDALNLPAQIANQSVEKQASLVERGLNLDALKLNSNSASDLSRLEVLSGDLTKIGDGSKAISAAVATLTSIVSKLEAVRTKYEDIGAITDPAGVNAAEIPIQEAAIPDLLRQRGLVAAADEATKSTRSALNDLDSLAAKLRNAEDTDEFAELQAQYLDLADKILGDDGFINSATFYDPATGQTQNLLRNGTAGALPPGTDATAAQISTQVASDGTRAITRSTDLAGFLTDLQAARDAVSGATFATRSADIDAVDASYDTANAAFKTSESQTSINVVSISNALSNLDFAVELDTQSLSTGLLSIDDSLDRATTIERVLSDIRQLGKDAQKDGADLTEINAYYTARLGELDQLINTPGSVSDGTNSIDLDNLLADGTFNYTVVGGAQARAEGGDLAASIYSLLPATIGDAAAGEALVTQLDSDLKPALEDLTSQLERDRTVIAFALEQADPRGRLDSEVRALRVELDDVIAKSGKDGQNLLGEFSRDIKVALDSLGSTITIDAQTSFESNFRTALEGFDYVAASAGDDTARVSALNDALFVAQGTLGRLKAETYALNIQKQIIGEEKTAIEGEGGTAGDFLKPIEFTDAARKFIERYLIQKDLESQGFSVNSTYNADAALASQIGSILPQGNGLLNFVV